MQRYIELVSLTKSMSHLVMVVILILRKTSKTDEIRLETDYYHIVNPSCFTSTKNKACAGAVGGAIFRFLSCNILCTSRGVTLP
jgi:hypothetical protein